MTAYNGKSVEVEDEGGDRQTITVKDEQADLPPLRCPNKNVINSQIISYCYVHFLNPDFFQESRHPDR